MNSVRCDFTEFDSFANFEADYVNVVEDSPNLVSSVSTRVALRSAARGDLVVPRTRLRLGNRAFFVSGPAVWNSLPTDIRSAPTLCTFKNRLKTHLFLQSYFVL